MPIIYLSPSTQENNFYVSGGTEEEWMNRLADAMEPYLTASGIRYSRNTPDMPPRSALPTRVTTTCTWRSTPMPLRRASTARSAASLSFTIPAAPRGGERRRSWLKI